MSVHAERREDPVVREAIERLAADATDDIAEQKVVDVAVDKSLARGRRRNLLDGDADRRVVPAPGVAEIDVGPKSRHVRHQVTDRDVCLCRSARTRE